MPKRNLAFLALIILGGALFSTGCQNLKLTLPPAIQATLTATPVPTFHYKMEWGGLPPNPPMSTMAGLALDSTGDVYVGNGNTVLKYDGNGNYINLFGSAGTGNGQFYGAFSVALDHSDQIYVADFYQGRVQKFDPQENYVAQWALGPTSYPSAIAVDKTGTVYVLEGGFSSGPCLVQKFLNNGTPVLQWGGPGSGQGQFDHPDSMALDPTGNYVYVGDNARVQKFDLNGNFITQWGSQGTNPGQFYGPIYSLATDALGNVYAGNGYNIEVFTSNGTFLFKFGTSGPAGVAAGPYFDGVTYGLVVNPTTYDVYAINGFWPGGYIEKWGY